MKCKNCGAEVGIEYRICPYCNSEMEYLTTNTQPKPIIIQNVINNTSNNNIANPTPVYVMQKASSNRNKMVTLILCIFLGFVGGHCFYAGNITKGILYLCTGGLFGLGWIYDIIKIVSGTYKDGNGLSIID